MKPHLLYIAFWFPPARASGVYRALATAKGFISAGWDVTVITCTSEFLEDEVGSVDSSLLGQIPEGIEVVRVPFSFDIAGRIDIRSLNRLSANLPAVFNLATTHRFQLDKYAAWIEPVVNQGIRSAAQPRVDHIIATGNPYSAFEAARLLGEALDTPYSIDYRDPWTIDVFTGDSDRGDEETRTAERRIVEGAWRCFQVNEAIAEAYRDLFPEQAYKQVVVHNGYDAESVPVPTGPASAPYRFGMLGTVNDRWPLEPIFAAWNACRSQLPEGSELVLGGHLGYFAKSADVIQNYLPDESTGFRYLGPVPKSRVAEFYASLDVVILPVPGGAMVTSGKAYEANALGIPVVCVQQADGGARHLLRDNPLALGVGPDSGAIAQTILLAADMAAHLDMNESSEAIRRAAAYERNKAIEPMVTAVEVSLVGAPNS